MSPRADENDDALADIAAKKETTPILRPIDPSAQQSTSFNYAVGAGLMLLAVVSLTVQSEVVKVAETNGTVDKPSLTAWVNMTFMFFFGAPASLILRYVRTRDVSPARMWSTFLRKQNWRLSQALCYSFGIAMLYIAGTMMAAGALKIMPVALVSAAASFDSVCILIISSILTLERPPLAQVLAVVACISGVVLLTIGEQRATVDMSDITVPGCVMVVCFPFMIALKYISFKRLTKSFAGDPECMCIWLSLIGFSATCFLWPAVPISTALGFDTESVKQVLDAKGIKTILVTAALATINNFTKFPALALTSPLFVAIMLVLMLPMTLFTDIVIMHKATLNRWLVCGSILVFAGIASLSFEASAAGVRAVIEKRRAGAGAAGYDSDGKERWKNNP